LKPIFIKENFKKILFDHNYLAQYTVTKLLPIIPKNLLESFDYGVIFEAI
jgi:hypothetical protein